MAKDLDLDVDTPDEVPEILRNAAQEYYESVSAFCGSPWEMIAKVLEKTADKIEEKL
jgi:isopenicillin N synthase-like dioxygenase